MPSQQFQDAVKHSKQLTSKPSQDELLLVRINFLAMIDDTNEVQIYAYYKQATQDPPIDKSPAPGTFDLKVCQPPKPDQSL